MTVLRSGSASDVGRVRTSNQDLSLEAANLFAVADGMGGHAGGEVAAELAVGTLRAAFARHATVDGLRQAVTEANAAVWRQSQVRSDLRGMGTTLTAAALVAGADGSDVVALANVGDSRAYLFSGGAITQVTADHSLAEEKVRHGELTEAEAAVHPHRHILTRALGVASGVDVDLWELHLQAGDRLLLCSDGLTNEVDAGGIAGVLARVPDPAEAARRLVTMANDHGGNDNITVVVVDVLVGEGGASAGAAGPGTAGPEAAAAGAVAATGMAGAAGTGAGAQGDGAAGPRPRSQPRGDPPPGAGADGVTGIVPAQPGGVLVGAPPAGAADRAAVDGVGTPREEAEPAGGEKPGRKERNRQRRLAGIPRRVTFRVLLFVVLLAAVIAAAYVLVRWYATDNWFVTIEGNHVVIYQGRSGGFLWFQPTLVDRTNLTTGEILPFRVDVLRSDKQEPTLAGARDYVANLRQEYHDQQRIANGHPTGASTTTSTSPTTSTTTTSTVPGAVTTTVPATPLSTVPTTSAGA